MRHAELGREHPVLANRELRFVDLCFGLGGFHRALSLLERRLTQRSEPGWRFSCVGAAELESDLRACYVRNFPDIDAIYQRYFPASLCEEMIKNDRNCKPGLRTAMPQYGRDGKLLGVHGNLACFLTDDGDSLRRKPDGEFFLPEHDLLCAGFPCQPFSKSGAQLGLEDTRGTVFHMIATILKERKPSLVLLENVGNFERHDGGNTWRRVHEILGQLGYEVAATEHVASGGNAQGLLSPHHLGYPHHRERFYIVAQRQEAPRTVGASELRGLLLQPLKSRYPFPCSYRREEEPYTALAAREAQAGRRLREIIRARKTARERDALRQAQLTADKVRCINHWGRLLDVFAFQDGLGRIPTWRETMPSFPIWGYELDPFNWYPTEGNPQVLLNSPRGLENQRQRLISDAREEVLDRSGGKVDLWLHPPGGSRDLLGKRLASDQVERWASSWPGYAGKRSEWPVWKQRFIAQNREWALLLWSTLDPTWLRAWLDELYTQFTLASHQKLEWNCKGAPLDIWEHILQFRPSGLRVKRFLHVPALVAMTTTQVPIVPVLNQKEDRTGATEGSRGRYLLPSEALQLQGFALDWHLPKPRQRVFTSLGNAIHAELVSDILGCWLFGLMPAGSDFEGKQVVGSVVRECESTRQAARHSDEERLVSGY